MVYGPHPIRLGLCLFPGAHAAVYEVVVAAEDGSVDSSACSVVAFGRGDKIVPREDERLFSRHTGSYICWRSFSMINRV